MSTASSLNTPPKTRKAVLNIPPETRKAELTAWSAAAMETQYEGVPYLNGHINGLFMFVQQTVTAFKKLGMNDEGLSVALQTAVFASKTHPEHGKSGWGPDDSNANGLATELRAEKYLAAGGDGPGTFEALLIRKAKLLTWNAGREGVSVPEGLEDTIHRHMERARQRSDGPLWN